MQLSELLKEQSRQYNANFKLNEDNCCSLVVNEQLTLTLEDAPDEDCFYLYAKVASIPAAEKESFFERALMANLFGKETGRAWFALDDQHQALLLMQRFDNQATDYKGYSKALESFLSYLSLWKEKISTGELFAKVEESPTSVKTHWKKL